MDGSDDGDRQMDGNDGGDGDWNDDPAPSISTTGPPIPASLPSVSMIPVLFQGVRVSPWHDVPLYPADDEELGLDPSLDSHSDSHALSDSPGPASDLVAESLESSSQLSHVSATSATSFRMICTNPAGRRRVHVISPTDGQIVASCCGNTEGSATAADSATDSAAAGCNDDAKGFSATVVDFPWNCGVLPQTATASSAASLSDADVLLPVEAVDIAPSRHSAGDIYEVLSPPPLFPSRIVTPSSLFPCCPPPPPPPASSLPSPPPGSFPPSPHQVHAHAVIAIPNPLTLSVAYRLVVSDVSAESAPYDLDGNALMAVLQRVCAWLESTDTWLLSGHADVAMQATVDPDEVAKVLDETHVAWAELVGHSAPPHPSASFPSASLASAPHPSTGSYISVPHSGDAHSSGAYNEGAQQGGAQVGGAQGRGVHSGGVHSGGVHSRSGHSGGGQGGGGPRGAASNGGAQVGERWRRAAAGARSMAVGAQSVAAAGGGRGGGRGGMGSGMAAGGGGGRRGEVAGHTIGGQNRTAPYRYKATGYQQQLGHRELFPYTPPSHQQLGHREQCRYRTTGYQQQLGPKGLFR
ncbi:unnamed protein product [Closterium sp. NIES-64]|nr:unnamed protein product [Closterium sp. NIES-64]